MHMHVPQVYMPCAHMPRLTLLGHLRRTALSHPLHITAIIIISLISTSPSTNTIIIVIIITIMARMSTAR